MFEDYLTNPVSYAALETYFLENFMTITKKNNNQNTYITPFYRTTYNNGEPFADANPIFSAKDTRENKIIRIIIEEDEFEVSIAQKKTEQGDETIVFGGISNLPELLDILKDWI